MPVAVMSDRMAQLESTSAILGEYMLRGYTLTDLSCDKCSVTPLMRESAASAARESRQPIQFCALCDGRPDSGNASTSTVQAPSSSARQSREDLYAQAASTSIAPSRSSPAGPTQADAAADSISTLLLQGYSLLSSNCPTTACRGIPLVGYPKRKDGTKDGRRMCVSCGSAWVDEGDMAGMTVVQKRPAGADEPESPRTKARRELYATGEKLVNERKRASEAVKGLETGMDVDEEEDEELDDYAEQEQRQQPETAVTPKSTSKSNDSAPLSHASSALSTTLDRLATSLERVAPGDPDQANAFVNIKLHTEAMKDVLSVLELVKRLQ